jgi:predicted nucleic acid-binding protein
LSYLLDTDIMIDLLRGADHATSIYDHLVDRGASISAMTYGELWEGIVHSPRRPKLNEALQALLTPMAILPTDIPTAMHYGEICSILRRRGAMISAPDILIASTAIRHQLTLVSRNHRHFNRVPGLSLVLPSEITGTGTPLDPA